MGDVSVQHVDHEIVGGIASTALGHEDEIPRPVEARAREGLARNPQMESGENETHEERSRCSAKDRPHLIAHDCSLCCYAAWVEAGEDLNCSHSIPSQAWSVLARAGSALPQPLSRRRPLRPNVRTDLYQAAYELTLGISGVL